MDSGNIVEIGSHEELLQIKEGFYSRLYKIQFSELALV
jgi:ABC-type multidrug transport system fused ATPase/permease subunit